MAPMPFSSSAPTWRSSITRPTAKISMTGAALSTRRPSGKGNESGAALGLAFDGDGDRLIAVDEKGHESRAIKSSSMRELVKEQGKLKNDLLVSTVMSDLGLRNRIQKNGFRYTPRRWGTAMCLEDMVRLGESSAARNRVICSSSTTI